MALNLKIGILGAAGFIGRHLTKTLADRQHRVVAFSRRAGVNVDGAMETRHFRMDGPLVVADLDAVVNLAGESILGLWTPGKKRKIFESRLTPTRRLVGAITNARSSGNGPNIVIAASGIGYYGNTGDTEVDETAPSGGGFLARVSRVWEAAHLDLEPYGVNVVPLRIGFVVGRDGGAIPMMRAAFRLMLGGRLGSGRQWMSWIHVDDLARIITALVEGRANSGPVNAVAPNPVTNAEFTRQLARTVGRPALIPVPAFAMRLMLGEFSELLLDSCRVHSRELNNVHFHYPDLAGALAEACRRD